MSWLHKGVRKILIVLASPALIVTLLVSGITQARAESAVDSIAGFHKFADREVGSDSGRSSGSRGSRSANRAATDQTEASTGSSRRAKGRQVASLGGGGDYSPPTPRGSLSGGGNVRWVADSGCLNGTLRGVVANVAASYGSVTVNSTCRSSERNRSVGGAPKSYHLSGNAVDFRVSGNISGAASYLSGLGGGYKHMGGGLFHVDTGPKRPF